MLQAIHAWTWLGSSVGYSAVPILQGCGFKETSKERMNKWSVKSMLLSLFLSL